MEITLNDDTNVRFLNGGSLQNAAYAFTCGGPESSLHVYLAMNQCSHRFEFLCATRPLGRENREEAERLLEEKLLTGEAEQKELHQCLLANTDGIIERLQGAIPDKCDAPVRVRRALGFDPRSPLRSWADVKTQLAELRPERP